MQTVVIYDSRFGNTEKIAEAIGRGVAPLAEVRMLGAAEAAALTQALAKQPDLLLVGGPTQNRGASKTLRAFIGSLPAALRGVPAASFDTRYRGAAWLVGSAAAETAKVLAKAGGELVAAPESFFVVRQGPVERQTLEAGEVERAEQWGRAVAAAAVAGRPAG